MSHLPTIKDVAHAAGVHFTTVSMALRGDPRLRQDTRNRILAAALRTGYRRNPVAEALSRRRRASSQTVFSPKIAFLANRSPEQGFHSLPHMRLLLQGAYNKARSLGYGFEVLFLDKDRHDSRSLQQHLRKNRITGLILGALEPDRRQPDLDWREFSVVQMDSRHLRPAFTFVSNDQLHAARLSFQRLRALGYRRVGLAVGAIDEIMTADLPGCAWLIEESAIGGFDRVLPLFFATDRPHADIARHIARWVAVHEVDAVVCNWAGIPGLFRMGGVPESVGCACMCLQQPIPSLAGVVANMELVGTQLTSTLAELLRSEQYGIPSAPTSTYIEGFWHGGQSALGTARVRAGRARKLSSRPPGNSPAVWAEDAPSGIGPDTAAPRLLPAPDRLTPREPFPGHRKPPTMRDVACLAGNVHPSTVSLALRNAPNISAATRLRVRCAAESLGYRRDPLLDAFNARRVSSAVKQSYPIIAFVCDFESRSDLEDSPTHVALLMGASRAAKSLYHRLDPFFAGRQGLTSQRLDTILYARGVEGVIAAAFRRSEATLRLTWERYCAVKIECFDWDSPPFAVAPDLLQGTRLAVRQLRQLGHARIGLLLDPGDGARNDLIRAGFLIEHSLALGGPTSESMISYRPQTGPILRWVRSRRIDAIVNAASNPGAAAESLRSAGWNVGWADISLNSVRSAVTGLSVDYERVGAQAVEQVVSLLRMHQRGPATSAAITYVPVGWRLPAAEAVTATSAGILR